MNIVQVEDGHEVVNPATKEKLVVSDDNAVVLGNRVYVTKKQYEALASASVQDGANT